MQNGQINGEKIRLKERCLTHGEKQSSSLRTIASEGNSSLVASGF